MGSHRRSDTPISSSSASEVERLDGAVGAQFDIGRLEIAINDDAVIVRGFEGFRDLARDRQRFIDRDGTAFDPLREGESSPSTNFKD